MDLSRDIEEYDLIFLDLETTGLDVVTGDSICEIGALKVRKREVIDEFHTLVNPQKSMPPEAFRIHKISDQDLKDAPAFEKIADKLISFLKGSVIFAYNVEFDMGFVDQHLKKINYPPLDTPAVDILSMARDALYLPKYDLATTSRFFNIESRGNFHRALDDAYVAYRIFFRLLEIFKEKRLNRLADFISLYGFNNDIFRSQENSKVDFFKAAIDAKMNIKIKCFLPKGGAEEKQIRPLRIFQENRHFYLLYQGADNNPSRARLNRIFDIAGTGEFSD